MDSDIRQAEEVYRTRLKSLLEPAHKGRFIAIDLPSGDYFLGDEMLDAYKNASRKYPGRVFVLLRVGYPAARFIGAR